MSTRIYNRLWWLLIVIVLISSQYYYSTLPGGVLMLEFPTQSTLVIALTNIGGLYTGRTTFFKLGVQYQYGVTNSVYPYTLNYKCLLYY